MERVALKGSLANKYRPHDWDSVCAQESVIAILKNQLANGTFPNFSIFVGNAGTGKTTIARIIANKINKENDFRKEAYIEVNAASNNRVEDIRAVIDGAKQKDIIYPYKIYILDEAHMLTVSAQNALLKTLEDCPPYTIFIMATTDPQKILPTIISRAQVYRITKIPLKTIFERLKYICEQENITKVSDDALMYIAKLSKGGLRDAISKLDMCIAFSPEINIQNVIKVLGISDDNIDGDLLYSIYDALYNADKTKAAESEKCVVNILENMYNSGKDIKLFMNQFYQFVLDVAKYKLFGNSFLNTELLPTEQLKKDLELYQLPHIKKILNKLLVLNQNIKNETNPLPFIEGFLLVQDKEI